MPPFRLYNTLTRQIEPFVPADPSRITFYTCGPTVYDDAHIGNFRSFLAADLLRRWIESPLCTLATPDGGEHTGPRTVKHVMNITDVGHMTEDDAADGGGEDKMAVAGQRLLEAKKSGKLPPDANVDPSDPRAIAAFYAARFKEDAKSLGMKVAVDAETDPSVMPFASTYVAEPAPSETRKASMIGMIKTLIERGAAYAVGEPGAQTVYFSVEAFPSYGELSSNTLDKVTAGAGGRVSDANQAEKKHPADFLLWKADPKHLMKWQSPWGEGYPGWHVECSVMAEDTLGDVIDLHSGGEDNIFPHHECERAQSCCAHNEPTFARHWFHPRFLMVEGAKMSKSKGTFFTVRDLVDAGHEPAAIRLELIKTHYRSNANFSEQGLKDSARMIERWRRVVEAGEASPNAGEANAETLHAFATALGDDLNIAAAMGVLNAWIGGIDAPTKADAELVRTMDAVLGVLDLCRAEAVEHDLGVFHGVEPTPELIAAIEARRDAKKAKDFAAADRIRDEITQMGYAVKDMSGGKVEVRKA